jgi:metal-responsive CopG/Arc/MetJ family transcriptional regulator
MPRKGMGRGNWIYVGIPKEIVDRIDKVIKAEQWGFRSRNDYVLEAVKMDLRTRGYYP